MSDFWNELTVSAKGDGYTRRTGRSSIVHGIFGQEVKLTVIGWRMRFTSMDTVKNKNHLPRVR